MTDTLAPTLSEQQTADATAAQPGPDDLARLTAATDFLDHEHPSVRAFVDKALDGIDRDSATQVDLAVALYYAVRDGIHYEVYGADLSPEGLRASSIIAAWARASACTSPCCTPPVAARSASPPGCTTATSATTSPPTGCAPTSAATSSSTAWPPCISKAAGSR